MPRVWVSIGSNVDRERHIRSALADLHASFGALHVSSVYESNAVGFVGDPFYNLVLGFDTEMEAGGLKACFNAIEEAHGRVRGGKKFSPRTLDVDLLTYGDLVLEEDGMQLPRDEILEYAFVLGPLAEVAGSEKHPVLGRTYAELWRAFDQSSQPMRRVSLALDVENVPVQAVCKGQC